MSEPGGSCLRVEILLVWTRYNKQRLAETLLIYVRAMWLMLQQPEAENYVIATGETHSVRELLEIAFSAAGLDWRKYVEVDPKLIRPAEVDCLCGNATKAREKLGWKPEVGLKQLIEMMSMRI